MAWCLLWALDDGHRGVIGWAPRLFWGIDGSRCGGSRSRLREYAAAARCVGRSRRGDRSARDPATRESTRRSHCARPRTSSRRPVRRRATKISAALRVGSPSRRRSMRNSRSRKRRRRRLKRTARSSRERSARWSRRSIMITTWIDWEIEFGIAMALEHASRWHAPRHRTRRSSVCVPICGPPKPTRPSRAGRRSSCTRRSRRWNGSKRRSKGRAPTRTRTGASTSNISPMSLSSESRSRASRRARRHSTGQVKELGEKRDEAAAAERARRRRSSPTSARGGGPRGASSRAARTKAEELEVRFETLEAKETERGLVLTMSGTSFSQPTAPSSSLEHRTPCSEVAEFLKEYPRARGRSGGPHGQRGLGRL